MKCTHITGVTKEARQIINRRGEITFTYMKTKQEKRLNWEIAVDTWSFNENLPHPLTSESVKIFIRVVEQQAITEERERVRGLIEKYYSMEEVIVNGQRFLKDKNDNTIPFGYPYPDTKEKYIIKALASLDKLLTDKEKNI